ncbi:MAG: hypothetical protein PUJ93_05835, partial [Oscillospiraceae bacterium]|nr:hypothetical protein [Oscillospiraceae bacterium]MDY5735697.1 hypothetical protein [Oscillospiraceae bacterium]
DDFDKLCLAVCIPLIVRRLHRIPPETYFLLFYTKSCNLSTKKTAEISLKCVRACRHQNSMRSGAGTAAASGGRSSVRRKIRTRCSTRFADHPDVSVFGKIRKFLFDG